MPNCFIIMPITTPPAMIKEFNVKPNHFELVLHELFVIAVRNAGFNPVLPMAEGPKLIHSMIIDQLKSADLVLCDMSAHNPNVFYELGIRMTLNKSFCLVTDFDHEVPFDLKPYNHLKYDQRGWGLKAQIKALAEHIKKCHDDDGPAGKAFGPALDPVEPPPGYDKTWDSTLRHTGLAGSSSEWL